MNVSIFPGLGFNHWVEGFRTPGTEAFFLHITEYGVEYWGMFLLGFLFWGVGARWGYRVAGSFFFGQAVADMLKLTFCVRRPWVLDPTLSPVDSAKWGAGNYSFPSGHTTNGVTLWGSLAVQFRKPWVLIPAGILILLIAFSRILLGVHSPMDILGGLLTGIFAVWAVEKGMARVEKTALSRWLTVAGGLMVVALVWLWLKNKSYPEWHTVRLAEHGFGTLVIFASFLLCWGVERQFICFDAARLSWGYRIIGVLLGLLGLWMVYQYSHSYISLFFQRSTTDLIFRALPPIWIFVVWPILLKPLEK